MSQGRRENVIQRQIRNSLSQINHSQAGELIIAYEPLWAIGSGQAASAAGAGKVANLIRRTYQEMYGAEAAAAIRILYGGSVTSENVRQIHTTSRHRRSACRGCQLKNRLRRDRREECKSNVAVALSHRHCNISRGIRKSKCPRSYCNDSGNLKERS